jgi:Fe-S-cluster containining protein
MSEIKFSCTLCGRCCQNHNIPLTLDEAISWLEDDGEVGIFCEADLWPSELSRDSRTAHRRKRSFAVSCGSSPVRVTALLVGLVLGRCKNLGEDLKCRIYERRPLVCRIYPAEISPFIQLNTASKACPPEAWMSGATMLADGWIVDPDLQSLVEKSRRIDQEDVPQKSLLCRSLKIDVAAVAGEGFVTYKPHSNTLLTAMRKARLATPKTLQHDSAWRLYSPSRVTIESLRAMGVATVANEPSKDVYSFLPGSSTRFAEASPI